MTRIFTFQIALEDFDVSLLPSHARDKSSSDFGLEVHNYLQHEFEDFGGSAEISVDESTINVVWTPDQPNLTLFDHALSKIENNDYLQGIFLFNLLLSNDQNNVNLLYHIGKALSDNWQLAEAEAHLRKATSISPDFVDARVELGVVLLRQGRLEEAIVQLQKAVCDAPENGYGQRNLGEALLKRGEFQAAAECLRKTTELNPDDPQEWLDLGQVLEALEELEQADKAYLKAIETDTYGEVGERSRQARSRIAQRAFQGESPRTERMDAVMYCLSALEHYNKMPHDQIRSIAFEIAVLGRNGLDVNDPAPKYRLKSMPGQFNGLQLVSLMYVGFQIVAPEHDLGFDLSEEYAAAKRLLTQQQS